MSEKKPSGSRIDRKKRVKILKKIIVFGTLTLIFIPLTFAIYFACQASTLKMQLKNVNEELNYYLELQSESAFLESLEEAQSSDVETGTDREVPEMAAFTKEKQVLTGEEIDALSLSDEELYDGYRKIYLTFDDGPSPLTDDILDILKEYDVKATFFVVRRDGRNYEKLYRRIVDEGHSIGLHSCTHIYKNLYAGLDAFMEDTCELREFIYMVTGVEADIYRFPGGSTNRVSPIDMNIFANALTKEGIIYFDWNVSAQDAIGVPATKDQIVKNVTSKLKNLDEAIILFHDLDSKGTTVEALPEILDYISKLENTVVLPITSDTNPIQYLSVKNN